MSIKDIMNNNVLKDGIYKRVPRDTDNNSDNLTLREQIELVHKYALDNGLIIIKECTTEEEQPEELSND